MSSVCWKKALPVLIAVSCLIAHCNGYVYVDSSAVCPCIGTKLNPYKYIQDGLNNIASDPDCTVIVNPGIYTGINNTNLRITDIKNSTYYTDIKQSILSSSSSIDTIIDCRYMNTSDYDFIFEITTSNVILSGFSIQNCLKDRVLYAQPLNTTSPLHDITLNDIQFINNTAYKLCVIFIQYCDNIILTDIQLINNTNPSDGPGYSGPGLLFVGEINGTNGLIGDNITLLNNTVSGVAGIFHIYQVSTSQLNYVTIEHNKITQAMGGDTVQAMLNYDNILVGVQILNNTVIKYNHFTAPDAYGASGGIAAGWNVEIYNSLIANNSGTQGAGLFLTGTTKVFNSIIVNNTALFGGGGLYCVSNYPWENNPDVMIYNSTIKDNIALQQHPQDGSGNEILCIEAWIIINDTDISTNTSNGDIDCNSGIIGCLIIKTDGNKNSTVCDNGIAN